MGKRQKNLSKDQINEMANILRQGILKAMSDLESEGLWHRS
jgi:hypothetical protein